MNWEEILPEIIGSSITLIASLIVAIIITRSNKKIENEKINFNERIEERKWIKKEIDDNYFENGLLPIATLVSTYKIAVTYALIDVRAETIKFLRDNIIDKETYEKNMDSIANRQDIKDLLNRDFSYAKSSMPVIKRLGPDLFASIGRFFQFSSKMMDSLILPNAIIPQFEKRPENIYSSFTSMGNFYSEISEFLDDKIMELKDYLWMTEYDNYQDFIKILNTEEYKEYLSLLQTYKEYLNKTMTALESQDPAPRNKTLQEFGDWVNENKNNTPLLHVVTN